MLNILPQLLALFSVVIENFLLRNFNVCTEEFILTKKHFNLNTHAVKLLMTSFINALINLKFLFSWVASNLVDSI